MEENKRGSEQSPHLNSRPMETSNDDKKVVVLLVNKVQWPTSPPLRSRVNNCIMNGVMDFVDVTLGKLGYDVRKKQNTSHRRSMRRRAYRNRVDIVNSTNETLWFQVLNATEQNKRHPLLANMEVDVKTNTYFSFVSLLSNKEPTRPPAIDEATLQDFTPIRPSSRKYVNRSTPGVILVIYRSNTLSSRLMYRTITSGATWEIFQETLDDYIR